MTVVRGSPCFDNALQSHLSTAMAVMVALAGVSRGLGASSGFGALKQKPVFTVSHTCTIIIYQLIRYLWELPAL